MVESNSKKTPRKRRTNPARPRKANYADVQRALNEHTEEILATIALEHIQLMQPLDGKGARIVAMVEAGDEKAVPSSVRVKLGRRWVKVPVEVSPSYEPTSAYGKSSEPE